MTRTNRHLTTARSSLALMIAMSFLGLTLISGCSKGVRGESPFAQVTSWRIDGDELSLDLRLRNVNDEALQLGALNLAVNLDGNTRLFSLRENIDLEIPQGGFETVSLEVLASPEGTRLLESLANKERPSVTFKMTGAVDSAGYGMLTFNREGHIYTVPGKPGEFR